MTSFSNSLEAQPFNKSIFQNSASSSYAEEEILIKILVLGSERVGKSFFVKRLCSIIRSGSQDDNNISSDSSLALNRTVGIHVNTVRLRKRHIHQAATQDQQVMNLLNQFNSLNLNCLHHNLQVADAQMYDLSNKFKFGSPAPTISRSTSARLTNLLMNPSSASSTALTVTEVDSSSTAVNYPAVVLQFWEIPEQELYSKTHLPAALEGVSAINVLINASNMDSLAVADRWATVILEHFQNNKMEVKKNIPVILLAPKFARGTKTFIPSSQLERYCTASPVYMTYSKLDMDQDKSIASYLGSMVPEIVRSGLQRIMQNRKAAESVKEAKEDEESQPKGQGLLKDSGPTPVIKWTHFKQASSLKGEAEIVEQYCNSLRSLRVELDDALAESLLISNSERVEILNEFDKDTKTFENFFASKESEIGVHSFHIGRIFMKSRINYWTKLVSEMKPSEERYTQTED